MDVIGALWEIGSEVSLLWCEERDEVEFAGCDLLRLDKRSAAELLGLFVNEFSAW